MYSNIKRVYVPRNEYNEEFFKCIESKIWSNKLAIMTEQLIDNVLSSNRFRFNRNKDISVYEAIKERVVEKLLTQLLFKFNADKYDNPFAFTSSMIRNWGWKYIVQSAKKGLYPEQEITMYDQSQGKYIKIQFVSYHG